MESKGKAITLLCGAVVAVVACGGEPGGTGAMSGDVKQVSVAYPDALVTGEPTTTGGHGQVENPTSHAVVATWEFDRASGLIDLIRGQAATVQSPAAHDASLVDAAKAVHALLGESDGLTPEVFQRSPPGGGGGGGGGCSGEWCSAICCACTQGICDVMTCLPCTIGGHPGECCTTTYYCC